MICMPNLQNQLRFCTQLTEFYEKLLEFQADIHPFKSGSVYISIDTM